MRLLALVFALAVAAPAVAQELPQFPKAGPPQPVPDAPCDVALPSSGDWLLGRWVAPQTRFEFGRAKEAILWTMERKGGLNEDFGWDKGAAIEGRVVQVSACTVRLTAGEGDAFVFDGVRTDDGKIFGSATNKAGRNVRFVLRRER
ncbi:MAG: hypothetical protein HY985_01045 [Magnetospirillum sp.]|nr:hypothetical protein [Magnetospirillum sp.]